jgi:hypothetical protein
VWAKPRAMHDLTAKRTLVKSPPELWSELSEVERLARHLGAFGEIRITRLEPEHTVAWEGEAASGTVMIEPSGWGTKVTLKAHVERAEPEPAEPEPEPAGAEPEPAEPEPEPQHEPQPQPRPEPQAELFPEETGAVRKTGFFARLFAWGPKEEPVAAAPEAIAEPEATAEPEVIGEPEATPQPETTAEPAPEPEPQAEPQPDGALEAQAVLEEALEALGSAHHRPFSRG